MDQIIGPYRVVDKLGEGGMGQVYRARDSKLNRDVALKVLPAAFAADPERVSRFEREAQLLAALNHPNVAAIYGIEPATTGPGAHGDVLVMELVDGPTLAEWLERAGAPARGLSVSDALPIARQLVDALDAAHERGIVHRDLKPANIKVRDDGTVKVLDFGLAKALEPQGSSGTADVMNSPTLTARSTALGTILGTAAYMSPEQAKGRAVDKRADIWAFGAVCFEMLTGQRAFPGDDVADTLAAVLRHEVDWTALPPDTPPRVRHLLARCLDRDLKRRLRDIADAREDLDATAAPSATTSTGPALPRRGVWLPWAAAALVAVGSLAWAWMHTTTAPPPEVTRALTTTPELDLSLSLSRDGTRVTYSAVTGRNQAHVGIRRMDEFTGTLVPGADGAFSIFSPDAQWIAYQSLDQSSKIRKIPAAGGTPIDLCDGSLTRGGVWLTDDTIVFATSTGLMRVPAAGGTPEPLTTVDASHGERSHSRPSALPDGTHLLFTVTSNTGDHFAVLDLKTHRYKTIAPGGDNGQYAASGHLLYVRGTTLFATPFDATRLVVTGPDVPVVQAISTIGPDGTANFTVSSAGLLVYDTTPAGKGTTLAWADQRGTTTPLPGQSRASWGRGRLSPDGTRVADSIATDNGARDIWTLDAVRGTATQLTTTGDVGESPVWTADGRRLVYAGHHNGHSALFVVPADSSGPPQALADFDAAVAAVAVSPDGRTILADAVGPNHTSQLMVVSLDATGRAAGPVHPWHDTTSTEGLADFSPDGRWMAYESTQSGSSLDVYVQQASGTGARVRVSDAGGQSPRWSRNGRELYYWANVPASRLEAVDVPPGAAFAPGSPHEVFRVLCGTTWDVTPDPNRFLVELTTPSGDSTMAVVTNWFDELRRLAPPRK